MKKLIFLLLILHSSLFIAKAQWVQTNGPNGCNVLSLAVSGSNVFAGTDGYGVYLSTNYGTNWTQTGLNNNSVGSFLTLGNSIFAGTWQSGIYLSTDNGVNWTQTTLSAPTHSLIALGNNIFAGTDDGVYVSTNNGMSWTHVGLNNNYIWSFATLGNKIFAGVSYPTTGGVYISTDNGINWTQTTLHNPYVTSFAIVGNNVFAGTSNHYGVYLSTDNGTSWTQTALGNKTVYSLTVSGNNIFAGINEGVYLITNNGISWIQKNQGFNDIPEVEALLITNNYIFAGTYGNSVWRRDLSEIIGIKPISEIIPSSYSLYQNYPNPFNPSTKIKFDINNTPLNPHSRAETVTLKVFDITGKEVATLVNQQLQPGVYEMTFDARQPGMGSNLSSGVYFYKLSTGDFSETKKMLMIK